MAAMILAKNTIYKISSSLPQTQSLFLRSSSSIRKFSRATTFTAASAKEKLAETGELTTVMSQKVKHKAAELKGIGRRSNKAKQGSYKARESSAQNMAGRTDKEASPCNQEKHWKKPPKGYHVLSTDASARKGIAGIGGLIRDEKGSIVGAFAARIPNAPTHVIETKAVVAGVKIATTTTKGVNNLIINSDSMHAVDVISGRLKTPRESRDDIISLKSMKSCFTIFEVRHVCRKANKPAHFLASLCNGKNENILVFNSVNIPKQLKVLASQDASHWPDASTS